MVFLHLFSFGELLGQLAAKISSIISHLEDIWSQFALWISRPGKLKVSPVLEVS